MRSCSCGAALDYAPDDVTRCYGCRQTSPAVSSPPASTPGTLFGIDRACRGINWYGLHKEEARLLITTAYETNKISQAECVKAFGALNSGKDYVSFLGVTPAERLNKLQRWYDDGAITKEEFLDAYTYTYYDLTCEPPKYHVKFTL